MSKMKYARIRQQNGQYGDPIPIGVDSVNVDLTTGEDLQEVLSELPRTAPKFNEVNIYEKGDYVTYNRKLYRFTAKHNANVLWENSSKVEVTLIDQMKDMIIISSDQPVNASNNELWIDRDINPGIQVPTYSEFVNTTDEISDLKSALSYTINPAIHVKKDASRNRYISFKGTKALQNKIINSSGGLNNGTGSGNNWTSDLIKIPSDKRDITVIAIGMDILWCAAFYDEAINFLSFFENQSAPTYGRESERQKNIQIPNNAEYIRFGFYSSTGYSENKYYNKFKLFSILEAQSYADNNELATHCLWGTTLPDSNRNIIYATNTVGLLEYAKFEKPVIVTAVAGYKIAAILKDPDKNNNTTSSWFPDPTNGPIFIPAGFDFWVGIRPVDSNAEVYLPENICEQVSIKYADSRLFFPAALMSTVKNGYALFGQMSGNRRCGLSVFERADEDMLFGPTSSDSEYTITMCTGDFVDYTDDTKWSIAYSNRSRIVIPKGTWYQFSSGLRNSNVKSDILKSFILEPLRKNFYYPMYQSFASSLIADIGKIANRIASLEASSGVNVVPSYYTAHLDERINRINALFQSAADQFVFITDIHLNGYGGNPGNSKSLINKIANETAITKVINGGDLLNRPTALINDAKTKRDTLNIIEKATNYSKPDNGTPQFLIIGNHDSGVDYGGGVRTPNTISVDEFMEYSGFNTIKPLVFSDEKSDTQYYFDQNGIRYIITNPNLRDEIPTNETYTDTWRFIAMALTTMKSGFHAIIMPHVFMDYPEHVSGEFTNIMISLADTYNNRGLITYNGATADFANCVGLVAAFIAGHTHMDFNFTSNTGIPIILTTTDNGRAESSRSSLTRTIGTVSEQAFDVFSIDKTQRKIYATRIGAGEDREFIY